METTIEIEGVNGELFTIAGARAGDKGVYMVPKVSGLFDPEVKVEHETPANYPGGRYVSHRVQVRRLVFAVDIVDDGPGSLSWRYRDSEWRKAWAFDRPATIRAITEDGPRELKAHLTEIEVDTEYDPHVVGMARVTMILSAYDPYWWAEDEVFEAVVGSETVTLRVPDANPTDVEIFPIWVVEGGATWTLPDYSQTDPALAEHRVELPALAVGENVLVNTSPRERQLTSSNNTPVWQRMNGKRFRNPIQPWTPERTFRITRSGAGTGKVQLRLRRPFTRPWGLL